jgi:hypothetical protein
MVRSLIAGFIIFALISCSPSRIAIEKAEFARLQAEQTIHAVSYLPFAFHFTSGGDLTATALAVGAVGVMGGGLGGALVGMYAESRARERGEEMARTYSVEDPAARVREAFVASAQNEIGLKNVIAVPELLSSDKLKALEEKLGRAAILDFKTYQWQLTPRPLAGVYRLTYGVRSRLFRVPDGRILWQAYCVFDDANAPATLEDLTANDGVLLKLKIDEAAASCANDLVQQFLSVQYSR